MLGSLSATMSVVLVLGQAGYPDASVPPVNISEFGSFDGYGFGGQLYPFDSAYPWVHGYFQEIPAYGGYVAFRPYNYKHVLSQSQAAGGWGLNPTMPYSQQFWHRYNQRATLHMGGPYQAIPRPIPMASIPPATSTRPSPLPRQAIRNTSNANRDNCLLLARASSSLIIRLTSLYIGHLLRIGRENSSWRKDKSKGTILRISILSIPFSILTLKFERTAWPTQILRRYDALARFVGL